MYIRPVHAELDVPTLSAFVETYPLGLLTTHIPHPTIASLQTSHIPFVLDRAPTPTATIPADSTPSPGSLGILRAHIARANPQCKALLAGVDSDTSELTDEVLVLFSAPVHSYVTPRLYTETKPVTGKVVPTWNYAAVQVYGHLRVYNASSSSTPDEAERTVAFLTGQMDDLTRTNERTSLSKEGNTGDGWKVGDAPDKYVDLLKKAVVGIEIEITRIEGRFKLSQESTEGDRKGVVDGFRALGTEEGNMMADMVEQRGPSRDHKS